MPVESFAAFRGNVSSSVRQMAAAQVKLRALRHGPTVILALAPNMSEVPQKPTEGPTTAPAPVREAGQD